MSRSGSWSDSVRGIPREFRGQYIQLRKGVTSRAALKTPSFSSVCSFTLKVFLTRALKPPWCKAEKWEGFIRKHHLLLFGLPDKPANHRSAGLLSSWLYPPDPHFLRIPPRHLRKFLQPPLRMRLHLVQIGIECMAGCELLEHPPFCASDGFAHGADVGLLDEAGDAGGAQLVVAGGLQGEAQSFGEGGEVDGAGVELAVAGGSRLEVHGEVVDEVLCEGFFEGLGEQGVGVELDLEAHAFDGAEEGEQAGVEGRLAAGDDDTVDEGAAFFKLGEKGFEGVVGILSGFEHEGGVVAEGAGEVAAAGEDQGGDAAGEVEEAGALETFDFHGECPGLGGEATGGTGQS